MINQEETTMDLGSLYQPKCALLFYEKVGLDNQTFVEHYDVDDSGNLANAHPLTVREAQALARALHTDREKSKAFLKPIGIMPTNVLHINPSENGSVIWFSKAGQRQLFFVEGLDIPNGMAAVPPMLWIGSKKCLSVFALAGNRRPTANTPLYDAPFFNVYANGKVCMGTVNVDIEKSASLEDFMRAWETYFFNSYFSHLMASHNPIIGNCVSIWKRLVGTDEPFPIEVLKKNKRTIKTLLE